MPTPNHVAGRAALVYVLLAEAWILLSDYLVALLGLTSATSIHIYKGTAFVLATGLLFFVLARRALGQISQSDESHQRAAEALRQSEGHFELLVESAPHGVLVVDAQGRIALVNRQSERLLGYTREELLGKAVEELIPKRYRGEHHAHWERYFSVPQARPMGLGRDLYALRRDGTEVPVEIGLSPMQTDQGLLTLATLVDITVRKEAEAQIKLLSQRLMQGAEEERRQLSRELHDETGQALTALKINLEALCQTPSPERVEECLVITAELLQQVRDLSLDLRPSLLDDFGLVAALRHYLERRTQQAGLALECQFEALDPRPPLQVETACFRIAQQALTNTIRHAQARGVRAVLRRQGDLLSLSLSDDGAGFDVQEALRRAAGGESVGMLGMQERALLVGGEVEFQSAPGKGATVRVTFPRPGLG